MKILAFGEVLWDIIEDKSHIGGAPFNFAAHAAKCGAHADLLSAVGCDKLGKEAKAKIHDLGVGCSMVQSIEGKPTGTVNVKLNSGSPSYTILSNVAYDFIEHANIDFAKIHGYDAFYFGTLSQRSEKSRNALHAILDSTKFKTVFYDVNLREGEFTMDIVRGSLKKCTIAKMNDEEVNILSKHFFGEVLELNRFSESLINEFPNLEMLVITKGAEGCTIFNRDNRRIDVPSESVKIADTVGAGDSFSASFLAKYLLSQSPEKAAWIGNKVGGYVASCSGAIPDYPDELKKWF